MTDSTIHPMVERLEAAAARVFLKNLSLPIDALDPADRDTVSRIVLAVLRILREPDEGMEVAGFQSAVSDENIGAIFTAMIDHILTQKETET
jgi:hypothetical protein